MAASDLPDYSGYQRLPSWVLGFHGCDEAVAHAVLQDQARHLKPSNNEWDWLGTGIYFWENDPARALQFALEGQAGRVTKGKIKKPCVIGAVIDLGLCLNMFDQAALSEMRTAAKNLIEVSNKFDLDLPANNGKARYLDREVFEHVHRLRRILNVTQEYQTVRSAFPEGEPLYAGTEITAHNHIQIAVRDASVIRGYFLPRVQQGKMPQPS